MPPSTDPRIDAYIENSAEFARPILAHLRAVVHEACPDVEETMKWSVPHFEYRGLLCSMAASKEHCAFGFWRGKEVLGADDVADDGAGHFGRLASLRDLPARRALKGYVKAAVALNERGPRPRRPRAEPRAAPDVAVPPDLAAALRRIARARAVFAAFPPSHRREYIAWITEAKRDETRARRVAQAVE